MIAASLNVGSGVRLIKPAKVYLCPHNTEQTQGSGCAQPWLRTAELRGERRYENGDVSPFWLKRM